MAITIQNVIDALTKSICTIPDSVDQLITGNPYMEVTGIAVTFMATRQVVEKAYRSGVNLIITHEGTYYSHRDLPLEANGLVCAFKKDLIEQSGLAIYRFHDYWHRYQPDGIMEGLLFELGWQTFVTEHLPAASIVTLPTTTVGEVARHVKKQLGMDALRSVGNLSMKCERIGILAGYRGGGALAIPLFERHNVDLILYGEGPEWETPEYVRDAIHMRRSKALLVLGHLESEQPGMKLLAGRLSVMFPDVPIQFYPIDPVFRYV
ncbi:Nif3-like dinuclear metal center hexameric protein [Cohnella mopanensis]|uniref:Nif3-like dinuclear metal center hexameric protein n=1 Tax=Cohnella mopanensis TaxID=2911966 RepID=UPI001EF8336E